MLRVLLGAVLICGTMSVLALGLSAIFSITVVIPTAAATDNIQATVSPQLVDARGELVATSDFDGRAGNEAFDAQLTSVFDFFQMIVTNALSFSSIARTR